MFLIACWEILRAAEHGAQNRCARRGMTSVPQSAQVIVFISCMAARLHWSPSMWYSIRMRRTRYITVDYRTDALGYARPIRATERMSADEARRHVALVAMFDAGVVAFSTAPAIIDHPSQPRLGSKSARTLDAAP